MKSGVTLYHCPLTRHTIEQRRVWHAIIALRQHTRMDDFGHGRHQSAWTTRIVGRHQAWHDIIDNARHAHSDEVGLGMPSWPLNSTHGRMMSGVECHHPPCTAHTNGVCGVWNLIIFIRPHIRSDEIGCGISSLPFDKTHDQIMLDVACHIRLWTTHIVERR